MGDRQDRHGNEGPGEQRGQDDRRAAQHDAPSVRRPNDNDEAQHGRDPERGEKVPRGGAQSHDPALLLLHAQIITKVPH